MNNSINFCGNLHFATMGLKFDSRNSSVEDVTICDGNDEFADDISNMKSSLNMKADRKYYDCCLDSNNISIIENTGIYYKIPNTEYEAFLKFDKELPESTYTHVLSAFNSAQTSPNLDIFI